MKYRIFIYGFFIIVIVNWLLAEMIKSMIFEFVIFGINFTEIVKSIFITAINLISLIILRSIAGEDDEK